MLTIASNHALQAACVYVGALILGAILLTLNVVRERRRRGLGSGAQSAWR
jgi:hypothetical protein